MRRTRLVVWLLVAVMLTACSGLRRVMGVGEQLRQARGFAHVSGRVDTEGPSHGPLVVVIARPPAEVGGRLVGVDTYVRVRPGSYAFYVPPGRYQVGAYEDRNRNRMLDPGERTFRISRGPILEVGPGDRLVHDVVIAIDATSPPDVIEPTNVLGLVARTAREQRRFSLWAWSVKGDVCELSDAAFGPESGPSGLWEMMDFLNEGLAGIYFLEPYDPERVPVLFVHGMSGYPQEFGTLIEALDRRDFQPWFYFYPSGFALDGIAEHLATLLALLQVEHGFEELAVVAHSVGGLASRDAILRYGQETGREDVRLFVTISTPWGGHAGASRAEDARIELPPAFVDVGPASDYLRRLFYRDEGRSRPRSLPDHVEFHMLFGFRMDGTSGTANDGVVTVASQARLEAQEQAATIRALDHGHVEILHSPETVEYLNRLLADRFH